jgi:hypothetical protein
MSGCWERRVCTGQSLDGINIEQHKDGLASLAKIIKNRGMGCANLFLDDENAPYPFDVRQPHNLAPVETDVLHIHYNAPIALACKLNKVLTPKLGWW